MAKDNMTPLLIGVGVIGLFIFVNNRNAKKEERRQRRMERRRQRKNNNTSGSSGGSGGATSVLDEGDLIDTGSSGDEISYDYDYGSGTGGVSTDDTSDFTPPLPDVDQFRPTLTGGFQSVQEPTLNQDQAIQPAAPRTQGISFDGI